MYIKWLIFSRLYNKLSKGLSKWISRWIRDSFMSHITNHVWISFKYLKLFYSGYATIRLHYQNLPDHRKRPLFRLIKTLKDLQILLTGMVTNFWRPCDDLGDVFCLITKLVTFVIIVFMAIIIHRYIKSYYMIHV